MDHKHERLLKLDDAKLMDIVKNYRQYGFDEAFRANAIAILEERGISKEDLRISGNFENKKYEFASLIYRSFQKNSILAFFTYLTLILFILVVPLIPKETQAVALIIVSAQLIVFTVFIIALVRSFINQYQFSKLLGENFGVDIALLYFFLGMPFYIFMYFYFRNQMKESMSRIQ